GVARRRSGERRRPPPSPDRRRAASSRRALLAGTALAPDLLVELDAVAALGGVAALLAADLPDLAEEVGAVALLGGPSTPAAGLGPGHPLALAVRFRHVRNTSRWSSPGKSGPLCSQMRHKATTNPDESHPNDSRTRSRPSTLKERTHPCRPSTTM